MTTEAATRNRVIGWAVVCAAAAAVYAAGVYHGYTRAQEQRQSAPEGHREAVRLGDRAVLAERVPGGKLEVKAPPVPKGDTRVRASEFEFKPPPAEVKPDPKTGECPAQVECPAVKVRFDLVEHPDGTYGVIGSSDTGEVLGGVDVPARPTVEWREPKWAVGLEYGLQSGDVAVAVDRVLGPFEIGASVDVVAQEPGARVRAMWRFGG